MLTLFLLFVPSSGGEVSGTCWGMDCTTTTVHEGIVRELHCHFTPRAVAPEPFGSGIAEGMLARKPVVATLAGGACEIIHDGVTGRLVAPGGSDALAGVLMELLNNRGKSDRLAQAGFESAEIRFSIQAMLIGVEYELAAAARGRS